MARRQAYCFPPYVQRAYTDVLRWLDQRPDAAKFRRGHPDLNSTQMRDVAAQFYEFFPTHYFKVVDTLARVIGPSHLGEWLGCAPYVCFVDIGCGAGCASAAFLATIASLGTTDILHHRPDILCIGVDPANNALALYNRMMRSLKRSLSGRDMSIAYRTVNEGIPGAAQTLRRQLESARQEWGIPCLPHLFIAQVNIVRPLRSGLHARTNMQEELRALGINPRCFRGALEEKYALQEVLEYREIMAMVPVDQMHIITIATTETNEWESLLGEMRHRIATVFRPWGVTNRFRRRTREVSFVNPEGSAWRNWHENEIGRARYCVDVSTVTSRGSTEDTAWCSIMTEDNLALAWARVRAALRREPLCDEIEIRLFDRNLADNLTLLQRSLLSYAEAALRRQDRLLYRFPKSPTKSRPRLLSRMEEEILCVAVIQQMGHMATALNLRSYAYRLNRGRQRDTEYLYDYWFDSYREFTRAAREAAAKHPNGVVLRADIQSYYTRIVQAKLLEMAATELRCNSRRVEWLLSCLLTGELHADDHEPGRGIAQGGIGSGFFGNVYMTPIDSHFGATHPRGIEMFRYVDDLIVVVSDPDDLPYIESELNARLGELDLCLNDAKTERCSVSEYLLQPDSDQLLDRLSEEFKSLETPLWLMDARYRRRFRHAHQSDQAWWTHCTEYRDRLAELGFHIDVPRASRKVWQYLWSRRRVRADSGIGAALTLPRFFLPSAPGDVERWAVTFRMLNPSWVRQRRALRAELAKLLTSSLTALPRVPEEQHHLHRQLRTRIRFALYRLCRLGLGDMADHTADILRANPWLLPQANQILQALAQQGHCEQLVRVIDHYAQSSDPGAEYMRAIALCALRNLPAVDGDLAVRLPALLQEVATDPLASAAERLIAIETWLHLATANRVPDLASTSCTFADLLCRAPALPARLTKNLILASGLGAVGRLTDADGGLDPMLEAALRVALAGEVPDLLASPEPSVIREKYYTDEYPDIIDELYPRF